MLAYWACVFSVLWQNQTSECWILSIFRLLPTPQLQAANTRCSFYFKVMLTLKKSELFFKNHYNSLIIKPEFENN